jgi:two-component system chemotaxis response regulator CheY
MVMAALRPLQATFAEASTGLEAIERLALAPFDAMTLDLNMPDMHGVEVLAFVRQQERFRTMPVVVISTRGEPETQEALLAAGASAYVTKPFEPAGFLHEVRRVLSIPAS